MQLAEYQDRYENIRFTREDGVLEMTLHTRGGPALWRSKASKIAAEVWPATAGFPVAIS